MSNKKLTKAQQLAEPKKRKKLTVEEDSPKTKKVVKAPSPLLQMPSALTKGDAAFPLRYAFAAGCGILLLIFLSVFLNDDGLLPQFIVSVVSGLFGRNVYYISIPALFYLIWLQLASKGKPVRGRTFAMVGFVLIFGALSHLIMNHKLEQTGMAQFAERYVTGQTGLTGGVICGLLTDLLTKALGRFFIVSSLLILGVVCLVIAFKLDHVSR